MTGNGLSDCKNQSALGEMWQEACKRRGSLSFKIASASMSPVLEVGDVVKVSRVEPARLHIGDIIAFRHGRNVMVHRLIGKSRSDSQLVFRQIGDTGGSPGTVPAQNLIGRVSTIKKKGREISLDTPWYAMSNRILGWRLIILGNLGRIRYAGIIVRPVLGPVWRLYRRLLLRRF